MISSLSLSGISSRGGRSRGFRVGAVLGIAVPVLVLGIFSLLASDDPSTSTASTAGADGANARLSQAELAAQREAFTDFEEALTPITERGSATVVYGMRPGINDIFDGRFDDETLVTMSEGWVSAMEGVRDDLAAVEVPDFLSETGDLYRRAFDEYVETARALHAAARAGGDERSGHITAASEHGSRADDLYDSAKAELRRHRQRLGLEGARGR